MKFNHASYISKDFSKLLENPIGYNVKIKVGQTSNIKEFRAHSIILRTRLNDFYCKVFSKHSAKYEDSIITFTKPNISPSVFEVLLKYIYTGMLSVNNNISLVDIIVAADDFGLPKVIQQLEKHLSQNETAWKFPKDFITISQHDQFPNLVKYALESVCKNPRVVFESECFMQMKEATFIQLLKCDDLRLEEIEIWEYLVEWGIKNTDSTLDNDLSKWLSLDFMELEKTLRNCIPHIRFFHMLPDDYTQIRKQFKNVIPDKLDDEIIHYFLNPKSNHSFSKLPLRTSVYHFDSKIIKAKDVALIASWIDRIDIKQGKLYRIKDLPYKFKLIYRASRDGFNVKNFHRKCDEKGSTVVIIKVRESGEIIGGYNPLDWRSLDGICSETSYLLSCSIDACKTSSSFIFSLTNRAIPKLSRISFEYEAIICNKDRGPCFGLKDLCVDPSQGTSSKNVIGKSRQHSYERKIINRESFEIEEYEVFQVIDKELSDSYSGVEKFELASTIILSIVTLTFFIVSFISMISDTIRYTDHPL